MHVLWLVLLSRYVATPGPVNIFLDIHGCNTAAAAAFAPHCACGSSRWCFWHTMGGGEAGGLCSSQQAPQVVTAGSAKLWQLIATCSTFDYIETFQTTTERHIRWLQAPGREPAAKTGIVKIAAVKAGAHVAAPPQRQHASANRGRADAIIDYFLAGGTGAATISRVLLEPGGGQGPRGEQRPAAVAKARGAEQKQQQQTGSPTRREDARGGTSMAISESSGPAGLGSSVQWSDNYVEEESEH
jgi:hypothetical protein